jgi:hypothetical protein
MKPIMMNLMFNRFADDKPDACVEVLVLTNLHGDSWWHQFVAFLDPIEKDWVTTDYPGKGSSVRTCRRPKKEDRWAYIDAVEMTVEELNAT